MEEALRVAAFIRVSTMEQHSSVLNQEEVFKQWFKNNPRYILYKEYIDEGISGAKGYKRVNWLKMISDAREKKFDIILCKSFSRFGRNQRETLTIISELREKGIRFIFLEDNLDSDKDMANFGLMAWLAEKEANATSERLKYIWKSYDELGKIHAPKPAYGYEWDKHTKNYIINEYEADIVRKIFEWYLNGQGYTKICRNLIDNNISTKCGGKWQGNTIRKILINETYIGTLVQAKTKTIDATTKNSEKVDKAKWIKHLNNHKPIVDEDVFYRVQKLIENKGKSSNKNSKRNSDKSLFSNLLICAECGSSMVVKRKKRLNYNPYYQCINYDINSLKCGHKSNSIKEEDLLEIIKDELREIFSFNNELIKELKVKNQTDIEKLNKNIFKLTRDREKLIEKADIILKSYMENLIDAKLYKLQNRKVSDELEIISKKETEYKEEVKLIKDRQNTKRNKGIEEIIGLEIDKWSNEHLKSLVDSIIIGLDGRVDINLKFKL